MFMSLPKQILSRYSIAEDNNESGLAEAQTLEHPELVGYVQELVKNGLKTCVIMRGLTGYGKFTVVQGLKDLVGMISFSTDDLFMENGEYKFDPNKLTDYHNQNFENFKNAIVTGVQCVGVDNTNIQYHEYSRYIDFARNSGYITVLLECKKFAPDVLLERTTHNVPIQPIIAKLKKYTFRDPIYYGLFITYQTVEDLTNPFSYIPKQTTPLHVTLFYGRDQINSVVCRSIPIGKRFKIKVDSFCTSRAGKFLKVHIVDHEISTLQNLHITLETSEGFKPVDVGTNPAETSIEIGKEITGVFGPIY